MKKFLSILTIFSILLSQNSVSAYNTEDTTRVVQISEFDYFKKLRNSTDEELYENGMSKEQITYIRNFDIVNAVKERSKLPESSLNDLGYSKEDIMLLKSYSSRKNLEEEEIFEEMRAATVTFTLNAPTTSRSRYTYNFSFKWSSCPIFIQSDLLAATWAGTGKSGGPINVAIDKSQSKLTTKYKSVGGAPEMGSVTYKWTYEDEYRAVKLKFDMGYNLGNGMSYWTQTGSGKLVLNAVVSNTIQEVLLKIGYGHSVVTGTPSVSFSGSGPSIGFSFGWTTQNEKTHSVRYRYDGKKMS